MSGLDGLIMELEKLKSYLNNVELQLYEANEHISELMEKVRKFMATFSSERDKIYKQALLD
jgi:hypothetical protein